MPTHPMVLDAEELAFGYGADRIVEIDTCRLAAGDSLAVIGPSGCGKTTFLHLLAGLLTPESGQIRVLDQDITALRGTQMDRFRGRHIGMVFQRLFLMPALNARQNIALGQRLARVPEDRDRVERLIEQLGIGSVAHQKPRTLSLGQAQRVAIARALVHGPNLVLADEPTSALDDQRAAEALKLLKDAAETAGAALLIVTHDERVRGQLSQEFDLGGPQ